MQQMTRRADTFHIVIPAKAGIQFLSCPKKLDPGLRRDDEILELIAP